MTNTFLVRISIVPRRSNASHSRKAEGLQNRGANGLSGIGDLPIDEETGKQVPPFGTPLPALPEHDDELLLPPHADREIASANISAAIW